MTRIVRVGSEEEVCFQLANYLRLRHPGLAHHFDYGSGLKMTMGQAVRQKRLNDRSWPDLFIAAAHDDYYGQFIEIKREGIRLTKKDGTPASPHIAEQSVRLISLSDAGYYAAFGVGYEHCVQLIERYLSKPKTHLITMGDNHEPLFA